MAVGEGAEATDVDSGVGCDITVGAGDGQAGDSALKGFGHIGGRTGVHCAGNVDGGYGTGEVGAFLRTVTDGNEFVEHFGCGFDVNSHALCSGHFDSFVTDVAYQQFRTGSHTEGEVAECVGCGGIAGHTLLNNRSTDDGFIVLIEDGTCDGGYRLTLRLRFGRGAALRVAATGSPAISSIVAKRCFLIKIMTVDLAFPTGGFPLGGCSAWLGRHISGGGYDYIRLVSAFYVLD